MSSKDDIGEQKCMKNVILRDLKAWQLIFKTTQIVFER